MKRFSVSLALMLVAISLFAWPVRVQSWKMEEDIKTINKLGISIDNVNRQTGIINCYVRNAAEQDKLLAVGLDAVEVPDAAREYALQLWEETKDSKDPMRAYYTLDEYHAFLQTTVANYPNLCQLVQIGSSVQNRPMYMLKISDNVALEENEPELKYIGSIHGDEVVGFDMLIRLIGQLTSQYTTNTRIANIVNNTEIWICPMMNPDGYALVQRYNAAGVDLNRNFPLPTGVLHPDGEAWQPETNAMIAFSNARDFDLSINFHGGALVINYPWDYTYTLAPDDALLHEMSLTYSRYNAPMYASTEFTQGVTNGAAWYVATGTMQDWNYGLTDCIEVTAEIGTNKWPAASTLDTYWSQNQESMLKYLEFAQNGVVGIVTNNSGTPLSAIITIAGNSKTEKTDLPVGDYHRLLLPGTYQVTASATGYIGQTFSVTVPAIGAATQNFVLSPAALTSFNGQVRNLQGAAIPNASITLNTNPLTTLQSDAQGLFQVASIYEGNYQISINANGYAIFNQYVQVEGEGFRQVFILQAPIFSDNFDAGISNWTVTGLWNTVTMDGSAVLTDSPSGNYSNNQNRTAKLTIPISLQNVANPGVSFRCKYALETGYDFVYVEASANGTTWVQLGSFTGTMSTWQNQYFSLANYAGQNCYFRFRLSTDSGQTADGIYIDDLQFSGQSSTNAVYGDVTGDGIVSLADILAINKYAVGLDPLPATDPRPWETFRVNNADADNNDQIDPFDCHLLLKYIMEAAYILPVQSGTPLPVNDPGISVAYSDSLVFSFSNPQYIKSLSFSTFPVNILSVHHNGFLNGDPLVQDFNSDNDAYAYAGLNGEHGSLWVLLAPNPVNFTLNYTLNGVPGSIYVDVSSASSDPIVPILHTALLPNYPNPFNPSTIISYTLSEPTQAVNLGIYNLKGQIVNTLVSAAQPAGKHSANWNGKDNNGNLVSSGVYLYRLQTPSYTQTRKMLLSK
ncbi:MAG: M14 family zinc carboxypeptidase [Candidatus Cloacimonas sp.]|jgi:predicted deacylase|nr:M14 family zinc carboxypeptidase [Candidatus Cloacimonas sp.]